MTVKIDKRKARRSFDQASGSYDQVAQLQVEMGDRMLDRLNYIRVEPKTILDMGSGTGVLADRLSREYRKSKVIAADFAHSMLQQTRKRGSMLRKLRCVCADAELLPLADDSVDLVVSNAMLQWCNKPDVVFQEWMRILKPGGLLMFTTFGPETLRELRQAWAEIDRLPHVNQFTDMHEIGDSLMGGGWEGAVMDIDRFDLNYKDVHGLLRDIKGLGAGNADTGRHKGLTGKSRMQAMYDAYEQFRREGNLPAHYEVINGHAWAPSQKQVGKATAIPLNTLNLGNAHGR